MDLLVFSFWLCLAILFYCFFGYGLLVFLARLPAHLKKKERAPFPGKPEVTLVVAAYLEDKVLEDKIRNTLELNYPVSAIFVIDGPTRANEIFSRYPSIRLIHQPERTGKYEAIRRGMKEVATPFVIFSDANSILNADAVERILAHYADPGIGAVAGEKRILDPGSSALGEVEGIYWKYESIMKRLDAAFYTVTGAAGELYSIRTDLFKPLPRPVVVDDLVISMQVCLQGYRIAYEPGACSTESSTGTLREESQRRIRIAAGVYGAMGSLNGLLNFFARPTVAFQFFSRKILRWYLCPVLIPMVFILNFFILLKTPGSDLFFWMFVIQASLYAFALLGWILLRSGKKAGIPGIPFYFLFMNYCMLRGFLRYLGKKQPAAWEKTER